MSPHSTRFVHSDPDLSIPEFDPSIGAIQSGYREISAVMEGNDLLLRAWAIGFEGRAGASVRYADIQSLLGTVGGDGLIAIRVADVLGNQFGSLSERTGLIGEAAEIWISAIKGFPDNRGAVLAARNEALVQIFTVDPYPKSKTLRAPYLLEAIATSMAARSPDRFDITVPDEPELMDRLPALADLPAEVREGTVEAETYRVAS